MDPRSSIDNTHSDDDSDSFNSSSTRPIRSTQEKMREGLSRFVAANRLPFQFAEGIQFEDFTQRYAQRYFKKFSSDTRKSYCFKLFNEMRENLILEFSNYKGNISISCDLWTGSNHKCYICVTAHYIDSDWIMQKRIIAVRMLKYSRKADHIFNYLMEIFNEFGVLNKIFTFAFDNVSACDDVIEMLVKSLEPPYDAKLFHVSRVCDNLNSIARDGLALVETRVRNIRMALKFISSSQSCQNEFGEICESFNLKNKRFVEDDDINPRWDSTYLMLKSCEDYRDAITTFYHEKQSRYFLSDDDWNIAFTFMKFLHCFHLSFSNLSPHSVILHFYIISRSFSEYRNNESIAHVCHTMEKKFLKYWEDVPMLFALSIVMDPRSKLSFLEYFLNNISNNLNTESKIKIDDVRSILHEMYNNYATKYKNANHRDFTYEGEDKLMLLLKEINSLRSNSSTDELSTYLETNIVQDGDLDVLNWWKLHEWKFPILSIMARDLLTLPVSIQESEFDLRAWNEVLEERRNLVTAEMFECMVCLKDWQDAKLTNQNVELDAIT